MLAMEFARFFGLDFPARFNITDVVNAVCAAHVHVDLVAAPFSYAPGTDRDTWQSLVGTLESMLRLHDHQPGTLTGLGEYLYHRSGGMIGSLSQLLRGAAVLAIEDGSERITDDLPETVPVDYAAERSQALTAPEKPRSRRRRIA